VSQLETALNGIADRILALDEASLASLGEKYKKRMEKFDPSKEWERSVIIFFIINAVRVKNQLFNEQLLQQQKQPPAAVKEPLPVGGQPWPPLKRVK